MPERRPSPPLAAEVDLRGLEYMPFFGNHLFGSEFNATCSDAEWRVGVTLWWAAWNQVPAASLPNDDAALARLADLGRDIKTFRKIKPRAMRGFVECSDGRLYHPFLAKQAIVAWEKRVKARDKKRKWREQQERRQAEDENQKNAAKNGGQEPGQNGDGTGTRGVDVPAEGKGSEAKRSDKEVLSSNSISLSDSPTVESAQREGGIDPTNSAHRLSLMEAMHKAGFTDVMSDSSTIMDWVKRGVTVEQLARAIEDGREQKGADLHIAYLRKCVDTVLAKPARVNGQSKLEWWSTAEGIQAKAAELGIPYEGAIATKCRIAARTGDEAAIDPRNMTEQRLVQEYRERDHA